MKGFREQLNIVRENGCHVGDICIAASAESCFNFEYTAEEFESLCSAMQRAWFSSEDISEDDISFAINDYIHFGGTIEEICEMSKWDLISAAANGWPEEVIGENPWCEGWNSPEDCDDCEIIECNCNPYREG
jgi:hypothetical protein